MNLLTGRVTSSDGWRLEEFSFAYVRAVAAAAACEVVRPDVDRDSVDLMLKRKTANTVVRSPQIDLQVKATTTDCLDGTCVRYPLAVNNYNGLRGTNFAVPRILVVVLIPPNFEDWIQHAEAELVLKRCGYWVSLQDAPETLNTTSVTTTIPRSQVFDPQGLDGIFTRLGAGGLP